MSDWPPETGDERSPDMQGSGFAGELLFIKYVDDRGDGYSGPATSWVADCPDGVDPRSRDNPATYTWEETWEDGWHEEEERNEWYIVGARTGWWLGLDFDIDDDHEETIDFDLSDLMLPSSGTQLAVTKSGGMHAYFLLDEEPPRAKTDYDGVDLLSDSSNVHLRGAVSPWHDGRRGVVNDAEPVPVDDSLDREGGAHDGFVSLEGRGEPILVPRTDGESVVDLDIPDDSPDDTPLCVHQLLEIRSSEARYGYPDSPFAVDTHLGMMMSAVGYSVDEALALLRDNPPAKDTGFDEQESLYQLEMLYAKMRGGDMRPPNKKLMEAGVDIDACDCAVHGAGRENGGGTAVPRAISEEQQSRRDMVELQHARNDVRRTLSQPIDGGLIYHAPQGLGKTRYTPFGAADQKRLVITTNKGEHRDTLKHFADQAGVSWAEVVPFGDSWLASDRSPVQDEVVDLYHQGVMPKYILAEYQDVMPEDAYCPYIEQFEGGPPDADLLMGSPGHENVARFRQYPDPDGEPRPRAVVYDDVNPADHEINQNTFTLDSARAGLNELIQEIPELESDSVTELLKNRADRARVERIAVGDGSGEKDDGGGEPEDVWDALDAAAAEDDAIRLDLVDVVRRRPNVRGSTVIQLKVAAGAEVRGVRAFSWRKDGTEHYSWVGHPDLRDHDVAILSATHVPHVTEEWMARANAGPAVHRSATDEWKAVRRAQGYLLVQTREARNSRSGGGAYHDDPAARRESMEKARDDLAVAIERAEGEEPGVIDAKKLIDGEGMMNFGRVWSNNRYRDKHVGLVSGATYYGDAWVEARAAYCGETIEIIHEPGEKAYSEQGVGQDLLDFMVTTAVEQAVTRFGRSDEGETRVYVDTGEVPPDFPSVDASDRIIRTTETQQEVYEEVASGSRSFVEIADGVDVGRRQVGNVVWQLEELGLLEVERHALENGRHRADPGGSPGISLNTIELPEIARSGLARSSEVGPDGDGSGETTGETAQSTISFFEEPPG